MELFEGIIKTLLEHEGYWVRQSFKVNLTKEEKRAIGKHSIPRPEIDLLAFKPGTNSMIVLEAKSYFDSPGVKISELLEHHEIPDGRYKLFTCENYRNIVFTRLIKDLVHLGLAEPNINLQLGLVAGNVYQNKSDDIAEYFDSNEWFFWSPETVKHKVNALAELAYENNTAIITAKILTRGSAELSTRNFMTSSNTVKTAQKAKQWLADNFPNESYQNVRASKYYLDKDIWFFTTPVDFLNSDQNELKLLLAEQDYKGFYFLKIPRDYLISNRNKLSIRQAGDKIDFHISALSDRRFKDIRGEGLNLAQFEVKPR
ncbi:MULTISPECIES: hypothetical protein [unclassified Pseudoalteromonas]|uniref:hypothetical protein n=1 Tax=unclassified Pseudoalteromonas TaxID=194690 RepID=UPI0023583F08|nr:MULTISPECIES: hypothetical protein [unclassified Pseudoalteromonas]MDC9499700.1 hypothetical protein [Pseudoalteromonas sp. Angola-20]MDC9519337.1 hypothetical protein [Pseudoalteromonas sp. Angola-22]MDC9535754.1 hypothetical protein [Pseudoalteromonas sp. Angola-9]